MTAEEVALGQFRSAVALVRVARKSGRDSLGYLTAVYMLARIIRAIRAERTPFHAMERRIADSIEGGIEAGIELIKARAYAQGRRDALRGVQGACLFEIGRMEERQKKYGGASWDWEGYPEDMRAYDVLCEVAEFAEEAAR